MHGLYIIRSTLLDYIEEIKFGMTMYLQSRVLDYKNFLNSPYYHTCYQFDDNYNKSEIKYIEQKILNTTKNFQSKYFGSEYRAMKASDLDAIIKNILSEYKIIYIYHNPTTFKLTSRKNNNKIKTYYCEPNRFIKLSNFNCIKMDQHQIDCLNSINNVLSFSDKCHIQSYCGTGKSIIAFQKLFQFNFSVIVMPSLLLIDQFYYNYIKNPNYYGITKGYSFLCVCSLKSFNCSTDVEYIKKFINDNNKIIIIITYMSLDILSNCTTHRKPEFVIFDEAHHITHNTIKIMENINVNKLLFMSATIPNHLDLGKLAYNFSYNDALSSNICKDFDIIIDVFLGTNKFNIYKSIAKYSLLSGNYKIITYHNTVNKCESEMSVNNFVSDKNNIIEVFNNVKKNYFPLVKIDNIIINSITGKTQNKLDIINEFDNCNNNSIYILSSCRSINEGIDIKSANCLVFCEPKNSIIDIIQNLGRISRNVDRITNTKKSTVIIPILLNNNFDTVINTINLLKNNVNICLYANNKICCDLNINDNSDINLKLCTDNILKLFNNESSNNIPMNNDILYPFGKELENGFDLPKEDFLKIIKNGFTSPIDLIKYIHFNKNLPQFKNIYLSHPVQQNVNIFDGTEWIEVDKTKIISKLLYDKKNIIMDKLKYYTYCNYDEYICFELHKLNSEYINDTNLQIKQLKRDINNILCDGYDFK